MATFVTASVLLLAAAVACLALARRAARVAPVKACEANDPAPAPHIAMKTDQNPERPRSDPNSLHIALVLLIAFWYFRARMKIGVAFGVCLILISIFAGERGLPAVFQARRQARQLAADIDTLRADNVRLRANVESLKSDLAAIERVARETLGLARPDELVLVRR